MTTRRQADPRLGIFETLLVVSGEPIELDGHLARLTGSAEALYGARLPSGIEGRAQAAAAGEELGRLRIAAIPTQEEMDRRTVELRFEATRLDPDLVFPRDRAAQLHARAVRGGLGSNKWIDREDLDPRSDGTGPLIADGAELLEAGWANLFAVGDEIVRTPPADGRILPGLARAAVLALGRELGYGIREAPLAADDLIAAEEVFLTNSLRGIESVASLDGEPLPGAGGVSRRLAAALAQRWRLPGPAGGLPAPEAAPISGPPAR